MPIFITSLHFPINYLFEKSSRREICLSPSGNHSVDDATWVPPPTPSCPLPLSIRYWKRVKLIYFEIDTAHNEGCSLEPLIIKINLETTLDKRISREMR